MFAAFPLIVFILGALLTFSNAAPVPAPYVLQSSSFFSPSNNRRMVKLAPGFVNRLPVSDILPVNRLPVNDLPANHLPVINNFPVNHFPVNDLPINNLPKLQPFQSKFYGGPIKSTI